MSSGYSPEVLAERLGIHQPTPRQREVIQAPPLPALVVAGAGSGKTETMAGRIVWLVAGGADPDEILGLTFTRKAARELATRIGERLGRLREVGIGDPEDVRMPTVSTYNAFAASLFREYGLAIGQDPDAEVIGEAAAWRLARRIIVESDDLRLAQLDLSPARLASTVVALSGAMTDHLAAPGDLLRVSEAFEALRGLELGGRGQYAGVLERIDRVAALQVLVPLVERYRERKRVRGLMEFSDQVAFAVEVCRRSPAARESVRERHTHVILDEYQDTSGVQTMLLSTLFRGASVMAVGDPNQSIYGWRGASAANLHRFADDFSDDPASVHRYPLMTSWRSPAAVLEAANVVAAPLRADPALSVEPLAARDDPPPGRVEVRYEEDVETEFRVLADWMAERVLRRDGELPPTAAVIVRKRAHLQQVARALRARGVPCHVLDAGGLLTTPEVTDLVAALRVLVDPTAGSALLRLLAGARWRIGVQDLSALERLSAWLADRDAAQQPLTDDVRDRLRSSLVVSEGRSIVDALDFVAAAPPDHRRLTAFSDEGRSRLRRAGAELQALRERLGLPLAQLLDLIVETLELDIETQANDANGVRSGNLRAFRGQAEAFARSDESGTARAFLEWVDRALEGDRENGPAENVPERGTVQVLTAHGSKGLEWDLVAVPRLVTDEFPAKPRETAGWLGLGRLPYELRMDAEELPTLDWRSATSRKDLETRITAFMRAESDRQLLEERRLAYVAITRARGDLLLTGAWWSGTIKQPRPPSLVLQELAAAGLVAPLPEAPEHEENPLDAADGDLEWPLDPLGSRRDRVRAAAALVAATPPDQDAGPWARDLDLLLAERDAAGPGRVLVPVRLAASGFKDWLDRPAEATERVRRPMPQRPYRATRLGTLFHAWVEEHYGSAGGLELWDVDPLDQDGVGLETAAGTEATAADGLAALKANFLGSPWATRRPVAVETEIHLPFDGRIVVCKIDAVFQDGERFEVVDWKSGRAPTDPADLERRQVQLALYRLAWSRHLGIDPELVDVAFYFVADDLVIRPERVLDEAGLTARWRAAMASIAGGSTQTA